MTGWARDARLAADTVPVAALALCDVRLMDDARYAWLVLVPRIAGATEWFDLDRDAQHRLADEIDVASRAVHALHSPDKLNVATLGNVVAQLHVHVIARWRTDSAWPGPVWGVGARVAYVRREREARVEALRARLVHVG